MNTDVDAFIEKLVQFKNGIPDHMEDNILDSGIETASLVINRLIKEGKNNQGVDFTPYTPAYLKQKKKLGRFRDKVDFSLYNTMLANVKPFDVQKEATQVTLAVGAQREEERKKMEGNNKHRPGFMRTSEEEKEIIAEAFDMRLQSYIDTIF